MKKRGLISAGLVGLFALQTSAQAPKVVTDTRYARGATMAFGRIKSSSANGGAAILKRGFCLSETPEPTVDDIVSTKQLSNNGVIYYFEDLKPATKYYMRAYATNKDSVTGYGDVIKFYTIPMGTIKLQMRDGGDQTTYNRIKAASEEAVGWWNKLTEMKGFSPSVGFVSGTPTADCSYGGWIRVGSNTSYQRCGTIMHEMLHGIGVRPWADTEWSRHNLRSGVNGDGYGTGNWLGDRVTAVLRFWDNSTTELLNGDYQHMWPYGINGAQEDNGSDLLYIGNSLVCQALGEDGLQHTSSLFAEPYYALEQEDTIKYYLKNESVDRGLYTSYLKPNQNGQLKWVEMSAAEASGNDSTAWYITFTPNNQYYQLRNAATGQYLSYSGSAIKTATKTTLTASENWHLMKGRVDVDGQRGYWIIHPESNWTPRCLQANANGNTASVTFNIANTATSQRWLIMTLADVEAAEAKAMEQIRKEVKGTLELVKALAEVPHAEDVEGTDAALQTTVSSIEGRMADAKSPSELLSMSGEALAAAAVFLRGATPTDMSRPFDLTYMLVNPTFDTDAAGWSLSSATVNSGCVEFYEKTFDFNQTVKNLPKGTYAFCGQGFQRPGSTTVSYSDYKSGTNKVNAVIYAGNKSEKMAHICDTIMARKVGKGAETPVASGKYVPNDMLAAAAYFQKGCYENRVLGLVDTDNGSLKVGVKSTSMPSSYWAIFDNFRLYFYGSKSIDDVTAIEGMRADGSEEMRNGVYDLQGRKVIEPSKGVYIVNGKKVVIK